VGFEIALNQCRATMRRECDVHIITHLKGIWANAWPEPHMYLSWLRAGFFTHHTHSLLDHTCG
jgi:hypothetical protein